mgnify:FL=1
MKKLNLSDLKIKIFADGADLKSIQLLTRNKLIKGFTTNPTLMRKAGVKNYEQFAIDLLKIVPEFPISFEVFADEEKEIERQAIKISKWGKNVNVKIPITNTKGVSLIPIIEKLSNNGIQLNITAMLTTEQVRETCKVLNKKIYNIVSVFAGRIADTGIDPLPIMKECVNITSKLPNTHLLWASPRQAFNIIEANNIGCGIITITPELLSKAQNFNKDLDILSLETVKMFYNDAKKAGYKI